MTTCFNIDWLLLNYNYLKLTKHPSEIQIFLIVLCSESPTYQIINPDDQFGLWTLATPFPPGLSSNSQHELPEQPGRPLVPGITPPGARVVPSPIPVIVSLPLQSLPIFQGVLRSPFFLEALPALLTSLLQVPRVLLALHKPGRHRLCLLLREIS